MALKANQPIRFWKRIGIWLWTSKLGVFLREITAAMFDIRRSDDGVTRGLRAVDFGLKRTAYFIADQWLTGVSIGIGVVMKALEYSLTQLFFVLWAFDFVAAGVFVFIHEATGKDVSLGEDLRRVAETIKKRSWLMAFLTTAGIIFLAIVWTGPEKIIAFFRKEIRSRYEILILLTALTAVQACVWAILYHYAYDTVVKLL